MIKLNRMICPNSNALTNGNYKKSENKQALMQSTNNKCMYCESTVNHIDYGDVEHIKPKSKYPLLEFVWENLGYACAKCNRKYKNDNYSEEHPIINPFNEDPVEFIINLGSILFSVKGNERADLTITTLGLNRPELIEKRQEKIDIINKAIQACFRTQDPVLRNSALQELKKEDATDKEYSMIVKSLFVAHNI